MLLALWFMATDSSACGNSEGKLLWSSEFGFSSIFSWVHFISLSLHYFWAAGFTCFALCIITTATHFLFSACFLELKWHRWSRDHHSPCKLTLSHSALIIAVSLTSFLLSQACSLAALPFFPLYPTQISKCYKPLGVLFGCPFPDLTTVYVLVVVEALVQIHHHFPFSSF